MSDPYNAPTRRPSGSSNSMWGWLAGIAVLVLIAVVLIAGWNSNPNTASNNAPPATTGSATPMSPPSTTGSAPAPSAVPPARQ